MNSEIAKIKSELNILSQNLETQHNLYQSNLEDYGSIISYRKELFGEDGKSGIKYNINIALKETDDIYENIESFKDFYNGSEDKKSFGECVIQINNTISSINTINNQIVEAKSFTEDYAKILKNKISEIDIIKNDLKNYRDQVVGGSLFSSYEIRMNKNDKIAERYSRISVWCFAISALTMLILLLVSFFVEHGQINYVMPSSISIISFTAAFFCSAKSKVYHKAAEEYAHKATLLKSFVGYR